MIRQHTSSCYHMCPHTTIYVASAYLPLCMSANYTIEVYVSISARQYRSAYVVALARHRCYVSAYYLIAEAHGLAERLLIGGQDRPRSLWHSRSACRARPREHLHTSAYVRHCRSTCRAGPCRSHLIRLHTAAYVSIERARTRSASFASSECASARSPGISSSSWQLRHVSAYVSIRWPLRRVSAYVSMRQHIRQQRRLEGAARLAGLALQGLPAVSIPGRVVDARAEHEALVSHVLFG